MPAWEDPSWKWEGPIPTTYNADFIQTSLIWLFRYQPTVANRRTFDEFSRTGLFSKMENHTLKIKIENYYGYFEWMHSRLDKGYNPTVLWNNSLVASGIGYLDLGNLEDPIETIFSDPSRRAILNNMIDKSIYMSSSDRGFLTYLNEVINEIEAEIQKN